MGKKIPTSLRFIDGSTESMMLQQRLMIGACMFFSASCQVNYDESEDLFCSAIQREFSGIDLS